MGLRLFFLLNFQGATFIQAVTVIPDYRVLLAIQVHNLLLSEIIKIAEHWITCFGLGANSNGQGPKQIMIKYSYFSFEQAWSLSYQTVQSVDLYKCSVH